MLHVEANLLCFPFFALSNTDQSKRESLELYGRRTLADGTKQQYHLCASRNTKYKYPGLLSRALHYAILSKIDPLLRRGETVENPITFGWRELEALGNVPHAGTQRLKDAIRMTQGTLISTNLALISKGTDGAKAPLGTEQPERDTAYSLYTHTVFTNERKPDGTVADRNAVWLSEWYLANLNNLYTGPLNRTLWLTLDDKPLASRMYEVFMFKFSRDIPYLQINYETLTAILPATAYRKLSLAKKQLDPAFQLLGQHGVIRRVEWGSAKDGRLQLKVFPGAALKETSVATVATTPFDVLDFDDTTVIETRNSQSPAEKLVCRYHALRFKRPRHTPYRAETSYAQELLRTYKPELLEQLLPRIAARVERKFPDGFYFTAAKPYLKQIVDEESSRERAREREQTEQADELDTAKLKRQRDGERRAVWEGLTPEQREAFFVWAQTNCDSKFACQQLASNRMSPRKLCVLLRPLFDRWRQSSNG